MLNNISYAVVLTRGIPVSTGQDTCVMVCRADTTIKHIMAWVAAKCEGNAYPINVEIVTAENIPQNETMGVK